MINTVSTNDYKLYTKEPWEEFQEENDDDTLEQFVKPYIRRDLGFKELLNEYFNYNASLDNCYPKLFKYLPKENELTFYQIELYSSTKVKSTNIDFNSLVLSIIETAHDIEFEDGVANEFSKKLNMYIKKYGNSFINKLIPIFLNETANDEILSEALRWIGRIDSSDTHEKRLWLLEHCLFSSSPTLRDGATLGLASMNDPSAITFLKEVIKKETIKELLLDMKDVLFDLVKEKDAIYSKKNQKK